MTDLITVNIGNGLGLKKYFSDQGDNSLYKKSSNTIPEGYVCPQVIDKSNWNGCHPKCPGQYGDRFSIRQKDNSVYANRIDSKNNGWGMPLSFKCFKKEDENLLKKLNLVTVPEYNELKTDYTGLVSLKQGRDNQYSGILSSHQSELSTRQQAATVEIQNLNKSEKEKRLKAISSHNSQVDDTNTQYDNLLKAKAALQEQFNELNAQLKIKIAEISALAEKLMKIKTDKEEAIRIIKEQIAVAKAKYEAELNRLNIEKAKLDEQIKKFNEYQKSLNQEQQKIIDLDGKFQSQLSKIKSLNTLIDNLGKNKVILDSDFAVWTSKFVSLESEFKKIEDKISKYLKQGEMELEHINSLLKEKRLVQDKLFEYTENRYNSQTHLIDDLNLEMMPSEILSSNQNKEIKKNDSKYDKLKGDIMSLSKNIQINKNQYRKKSFYIFLLTHVFVVLILLLIVFILMRNGTI